MNFIKKLSNQFKNRKKVVYTVITGKYDELLTPVTRSKGWDYICFTDNSEVESDFWQINRVNNSKNL